MGLKFYLYFFSGNPHRERPQVQMLVWTLSPAAADIEISTVRRTAHQKILHPTFRKRSIGVRAAVIHHEKLTFIAKERKRFAPAGHANLTALSFRNFRSFGYCIPGRHTECTTSSQSTAARGLPPHTAFDLVNFPASPLDIVDTKDLAIELHCQVTVAAL